ncbi:MAG: MbnP family protein [Luteibaculaceae bacterium]
MNTKFYIALLSIAIIFSACSREEEETVRPTEPPLELGTASVNIIFDHKWGPGTTPFQMETDLIHPGNGNTIRFTTLNFFISNVQLRNTDGTWWSEEESYHVNRVTANNTAPFISIAGVPVGDYDAVRYFIGVDSTRNVSGAQVGALDPASPTGAQGMFWNWNTGYIFVRAEGNSPQSGRADNGFTYHIGGFRNANNTNAIVVNTHTFNNAVLQVRQHSNHGQDAKIHMHVNAARFWHGGVDIGVLHTQHAAGANAVMLANNFGGGFRVDHLH